MVVVDVFVVVDDEVFDVIDDEDEVVFVDCCYVFGFELVFFGKVFGCCFWVVLVIVKD